MAIWCDIDPRFGTSELIRNTLAYLANYVSLIHCMLCKLAVFTSRLGARNTSTLSMIRYNENLSYVKWASCSQNSSTLDNVNDWKWKLNMLLRNKDEQEVVSRERKDRRDFEQLSALATRMGLHSRQYSKVVVFSKVPLANYRHDLDDKRPQREVVLGFDLQRHVDIHLKRHLSHKHVNMGTLPNRSISRSSSPPGNQESSYNLSEAAEQMSAVKERTLRQKSLQIRNRQQAWQIANEENDD
ncbi:DExH-box ATP-dependent RNA helicase DExH3 [Bienertia sinuspersici]